MALLWFFVLVLTCFTLYCLFLDPLRKIPGPWYARLSSLWLAKQCRLGRRAKAVHLLHKDHGNIVRIAANHVSINSAVALHDIFSHDRQFPKGPWYNTFKYGDTWTNGLVALESADIHRAMRKDMAGAFSPRALKDFESRMSVHHRLFKEKLVKQVDEGGGKVELDLNPWASLLAFDIIADFSFGKSFGFLAKGRDDEGLMVALERRGMVANALGVLPIWMRPWMPWIPFDGFWKASKASIQEIRRIAETATVERLAISDEGVGSKDLLSYMVSAKSINGESWSRTRIFNQATQTVIAGSDSTAASTIHLIDFISRHTDVQRKIQAEIDDLFPGPQEASWIPTDADTANLTYTRAVLHEVLRLTPTAASGFERVVAQPNTVFLGYDIPVGTLVSVPTYTLHRSPDVFQDPKMFRPERWISEDAAAAMKNWNLFSQGPRNCIGRTFALMEITKTITVLFKLFTVERVIGGETEVEEGFFLKCKECLVRMRRRSVT